jgi:hypothetical protein
MHELEEKPNENQQPSIRASAAANLLTRHAAKRR